MAKKKTSTKASKTAAAAKARGKVMPAKKAGTAKAAKAPPKKASAGGVKGGGGPVAMSSGKGPDARAIGMDLVAMFNRGESEAVEAKYWSPSVVSIEGMTDKPGMMWSGAKAAKAKGDAWMSAHTIHGASADGPYVGATSFAVKFTMDVTAKATGMRFSMEEVGVYLVQNGKIAREEFMYGSMTVTHPGSASR